MLTHSKAQPEKLRLAAFFGAIILPRKGVSVSN